MDEPNRIGILRKITELEDAVHPHNIEIGHTVGGIVTRPPLVGRSCCVIDPGVGGFSTSMITEIIEDNGDEITFKTLNSTYVLTYL
jgi:hypothetical protein